MAGGTSERVCRTQDVSVGNGFGQLTRAPKSGMIYYSGKLEPKELGGHRGLAAKLTGAFRRTSWWHRLVAWEPSATQGAKPPPISHRMRSAVTSRDQQVAWCPAVLPVPMSNGISANRSARRSFVSVVSIVFVGYLQFGGAPDLERMHVSLIIAVQCYLGTLSLSAAVSNDDICLALRCLYTLCTSVSRSSFIVIDIIRSATVSGLIGLGCLALAEPSKSIRIIARIARILVGSVCGSKLYQRQPPIYPTLTLYFVYLGSRYPNYAVALLNHINTQDISLR